jgi:hypothetical protein
MPTQYDDEHPDHQLGINRRFPCLTIKRRQLTTQIAEGDEAINRQSSLFDLPWPHNRVNPRRRTRIESVLMHPLKQSFSTGSARLRQ